MWEEGGRTEREGEGVSESTRGGLHLKPTKL